MPKLTINCSSLQSSINTWYSFDRPFNHYTSQTETREINVFPPVKSAEMHRWAQSIQPKFPEIRSEAGWIGWVQPEKFR